MKWIKHDTNANQDAKLQNVLLDYGLEGYGLYWYCIELIASGIDKENITFELEHDARIIARNVGSTAQKIEEMMKYFVDIGLFENASGVITCLKLASRLDKSMTSNPEMRNIIERLKNHDSIMTQSEFIMQDKNRLEENRVNKDTVSPSGSNRLPPVPYQKILDLYHEKTTLPRVAVLSDKRKRSIKARWKEELLSDLEAWENYFNYVANTPFLNGSNDRGWTADFDFLIKPETPIKCQEGKYTNEVR